MTRRRIVIGSGVAGLTAAYVLSRSDDVTLFEAERRLGGQRGLGGLAAGLPTGRLRYAWMLGELLRFHRSARKLLASGNEPGAGGHGAGGHGAGGHGAGGHGLHEDGCRAGLVAAQSLGGSW